MVSPKGIFTSSAQTRFWNPVPLGASGKSKVRRFPVKNSSSWRATTGFVPLPCPGPRVNAVTAPLLSMSAHAGPKGVSNCMGLLFFFFEAGPDVIRGQASIGTEAGHHLADAGLGGALAVQA